MKILIRLPNWVGDAVMATPALESLKASYPDAKFTLIGSFAATALFENDDRVESLVIDDSKKAKSRIFWLYRKAKEIGSFDISITFQNSFLSAIFLFFTGSKNRVGYAREFRSHLLTYSPKENRNTHQVMRYLELVRPFCTVVTEELSLQAKDDKQNLCIINPGAAYGEAKRWDAAKFGEVAVQMSKSYDIVLVGSKDEIKIGEEVDAVLRAANIKNYKNLVGKTSMKELVELIASAKLFITNDSGPMHIAAAFKVPTIAIFGPTDDSETSAWKNPKYAIVKKELKCQPCKKRICPLKHHDCMKLIEVNDILTAIKNIT